MVVSNTSTVAGSSTTAGDYTHGVSVDDGSGAGGSTSASITVAFSSADADGDGFDAESSGGTDCDDSDPLVNPDATEVPDDGIDNDCDDVQLTSVSESTLSAGDSCYWQMQINPLNPNPSTIFSKGEWLEIHNTTSNLVNLNGLVVSDYLSQSFTVSSDVYVEANGYVTFGLSNDQTNNGGVSHDYVYGSDFRFGNADAVFLHPRAGTELDEVDFIVEDSWSGWRESDSDSTKGASLSLVDFSVDLDSAGSGSFLMMVGY